MSSAWKLLVTQACCFVREMLAQEARWRSGARFQFRCPVRCHCHLLLSGKLRGVALQLRISSAWSKDELARRSVCAMSRGEGDGAGIVAFEQHEQHRGARTVSSDGDMGTRVRRTMSTV